VPFEIGPNSAMLAFTNITTMTTAVAIKAASAATLSAGYPPNSIESIEHSLKILRIFLVIFTWMVGIGLVLEYKTQLFFICRGLLKVVGLKSNSFDRCQLKKLVWHSLGALLVTVGVLGEFWIEFKQYGAESNFSRASAAARDELNARTAEAEKIAKGFDAKISESDAKAKSAEATAKNFEAQIADANARTAQAELELARIKTPRSLKHIPEVVAALKPFKGTEYTFSSVCQEQECLVFLKQLDSVLQEAKWKRGKGLGGFPAIKVFGSNVDFAVPLSLTDGIAVRAESRESLASLQALPLDKLPLYIGAAITLNLALFPNLDPPQGGDHKVDVEPGDSTVVQIAIGKKP